MRANNDYILNSVDLEEEVNDEQNDYDKLFLLLDLKSFILLFYSPLIQFCLVTASIGKVCVIVRGKIMVA